MENSERWFVLGNGLQINAKEIQFFKNLKINSVEPTISIFDLAAAGSKGFREWAVLEPVSSSCKFEIESSNEGISKGYDALNRAWLLNTMLVLRGRITVNSVACSIYSWNQIAGAHKTQGSNLPDFKGSLLDFNTQMIRLQGMESRNVSEQDIEWIQRHFEIANKFSNENANFRFAIETVNSWRYAKDIKSAIAIIWAAIESIIGVSSEIVYRISLNISSILEDRGEKRVLRFKEIKKIYGLRSKVVHGSELSKEQVVYTIEKSFVLLADLIIYILENNKLITDTDFENAIFF